MFDKILDWRKRDSGSDAVAEKNKSEESLEGALEQLWLNAALSKEEFYLTYAPVIKAAMAAADNGIQRKALYKRIRFTLRASNGVIFGRMYGLDIEDSMVMSQVFAFAATVVIALETYTAADRENEAVEWHVGWELFKAQDVLSKEGWEWLTQYPPVFNDWLACFLTPERSEIKKLLAIRPRKTVAQKEKKAPRQSAGAAYLLWLKHKLAEEKIRFNSQSANIHVLDGERVFLVVPNALQHYADEQQVTAVAMKNSLKRLNVHVVQKVDDDKSEIFSATVDGKKKRGMILCDARLLFDDVPAESEYVAINDSGKN